VEASFGYRCGDGFDLQLGRNLLQRRLHQAPDRLPVVRHRLRCRRLQIQVRRLRARPAIYGANGYLTRSAHQTLALGSHTPPSPALPKMHQPASSDDNKSASVAITPNRSELRVAAQSPAQDHPRSSIPHMQTSPLRQTLVCYPLRYATNVPCTTSERLLQGPLAPCLSRTSCPP
jgi:hypothetical protein